MKNGRNKQKVAKYVGNPTTKITTQGMPTNFSNYKNFNKFLKSEISK